MPSLQISTVILTLGLVLLLARPAHAFGAGNIASTSTVEGTNWRHGDIEDTLLTLLMSRAAGGKKFDKIMVARVYFGNWLRDYSQAIDVGTVKYVSAEGIRILLWVLGFMTFGYGTKEFEVTSERLGCYRPEDHIDNPKDYADNLDARQYDPRLRGPVNERVELAIDPRRGLKNYIASEEVGITTSAGHVRNLFTRSIELGRSYARSKNKAELYEALRLLGTGCHCLEDWSAHSNYTELALIEMGERGVFPHVGQQTQIHLQGAQHPVFPIVTGTFGGVDFLHSVMGEFDDKATQSEIEQLEGTMAQGNRGSTSLLKELLDKIPSGIFGGSDHASKADELQANATQAQMQQMRVSPRDPEAFTIQMQGAVKQIYPIIEWHDEVMQSISAAIEKIPVLPGLIEQFENEINIFVFSLMAPFVLPIIEQMKSELNTGSSEVIQSSKDKQHIVFNDPHSSDPTHSMLSKDHFSNILNEPAGKIAGQVLKWAVPQLIQCWDDERADVNRTINRIINGVFHHPALRNQGDDGASDGRRQMFSVVEQWWGQKDEREKNQMRRQLSRDGVLNMENHKEGVHDTGHGCGKPIGMPKSSSGEGADGGMIGNLVSALGGGSMAASAGQGYGRPIQASSEIGKFAENAAGGGVLGGLVGALAGGVGGSLLGGVFGSSETKSSTSQYQAPDGSVTQSYTEVGHGGNKYGQAQYQETQFPSGGQRTDFQRYEQTGASGSSRLPTGYGYEEKTETRPTYGGGYEETTERRYQRGEEVRTEREEKHYKSRNDDSDDSDYKRKKKEKKHHKKKSNGGNSDSDDDKAKHGHGNAQSGYGGGYQEPPRQEYGGRNEYSQGRQEQSGYGGGYQEPPRQEYGGRNEPSHGRQEQSGYGGGYQEPPRQEYGGGGGYGGSGGYQEPARQEYGSGGYGRQEPPREEYGGFTGRRESPREEYNGGRDQNRGGYDDVPGGFGDDDEGRGGRDRYAENEQSEYRRQEDGEERREEGRGGWFS